MKPLNKILLINGIIMLIYAIAIIPVVETEKAYAGIGFMLFMMYAVGIQTVVNLIIGIYHFVMKNNERGRYFLLSALLIGVVGFSACFGGGALI